MTTRSDKLRLKRTMFAGELNRRAGGDIDKILPALDDMLAEAKEKRDNAEAEDEAGPWDW